MLTKVLITCWFNDKILDDHFLVHDGRVIMMFYVPQEPKSGHIIDSHLSNKRGAHAYRF